MPTTYKNAQLQGTTSTTTYANLYNTASATTAVISSVLVANTSSSQATVRLAIVPASASAANPSASNWIVYDAVVAGNDTIALTIGATLSASQFIRVSSSANTVTFSAFVSEIT